MDFDYVVTNITIYYSTTRQLKVINSIKFYSIFKGI